jgi:hypothetical protein
MFLELILPCYKKLTGMLRDHGVKIMMVDSDGHIWKLIPLFLEGGVTCMGPMEVAAEMDVVCAEQRECSGGLKSLWRPDEGRYIQRRR